MDSVFSFVVGILTTALSLLGFVQQHPELPQASKDQAQQVAQQAITQATQALMAGNKNPIHAPSPTVGTQDYKGSWFKITHPANFVAKAEGADEASFTSPDGLVEFYVYSPQWSGNPVSYLQPLSTEVVESDTSNPDVKSTTNSYGATHHKKITRYVTFAANDGSYKRSFVSVTAGYVTSPDSSDYSSKTHTVFGIKYRDQSAYDKHLNEYLAFKKSLVQYAD